MIKTKPIFLLASVILIAACNQESIDEHGLEGAASGAVTPVAAGTEVDASIVEIVPGLTMRILKKGSGAVAEAGMEVTVHYTGWLHDVESDNARGEKFDSSVDRDQHFVFTLGKSRVIKGWHEGVAGMKVGEVRELTIAPELAYGNRSRGPIIGPGSTLVFEIELAGLSDEREAVAE